MHHAPLTRVVLAPRGVSMTRAEGVAQVRDLPGPARMVISDACRAEALRQPNRGVTGASPLFIASCAAEEYRQEA
jgi:hypothetical protein